MDKITPPGLIPLDKTGDKVANAWRREQQNKSAEAQAILITERVNAGESITVVAAGLGLKVETSEPFTRDGTDTIPPELTQKIFPSKVGHMGMSKTKDGFVVTRVASIKAGDTSSNDEENLEMQNALIGSMRGDLINQFASHLRGHYKIIVNKRVLDDSF